MLEQRAEEWIQELYGICRKARNDPTDESTEFMRVAWAFEIEPFINEQLPNLLLVAAGFNDIRRKLLRHDPVHNPSLRKRASICDQVRETIRSRWNQKLSTEDTAPGARRTRLTTSSQASSDTSTSPSPVAESAPIPLAVKSKAERRLTDFEKLAGSLFDSALQKSAKHRVSNATLLYIADRLDTSPFRRPKDHLERLYRIKVAEYNKKLGTDKALTTWRKLASNPIHQRGMRRTLAHAAQKLRKNLSAQPPATTF